MMNEESRKQHVVVTNEEHKADMTNKRSVVDE